MKFVMETMKRKEAIERLPVIKLEIDYELLTLYDAMQADDHVQMIKSKERLEFLRQQMNEINNDK
ncbi:hypothetical protein D8M05_07665 [Oceanobacillus bengalensis]|uniref:Uncharacterized protein n=1 Tax=Oceanobacillus bengalensis TaxID=1435466 RepID=A0A494Z1M7_9BACI|nr:hypothetical protein [Oceanobacillus bengalensis]RKQ16348.1 hypothetical protein D8M05_07665 [Oceanobacillus bengalensis]